MTGSEISRKDFIGLSLTVLTVGLATYASDYVAIYLNSSLLTPTPNRLDTDPLTPPYLIDPTVTLFDTDSPILTKDTPTPETVSETGDVAQAQKPKETARLMEIPFDADQKVPVLEYHNPAYGTKEGKPGDVYMTMDIFKRQMEVIKKLGLKTP